MDCLESRLVRLLDDYTSRENPASLDIATEIREVFAEINDIGGLSAGQRSQLRRIADALDEIDVADLSHALDAWGGDQ